MRDYFSKLTFISIFTSNCISTEKLPISMAKRLLKIASKNVIKNIPKSRRNDFNIDDFENIFVTIFERFYSIISYHESILYLCINKHGLNSMVNLRTELESTLIFFYLIDPFDDLLEIEKRIEEYDEWVIVQSYKNFQKTKNYKFLECKDMSDYDEIVTTNYNRLKTKYGENIKQFDRPSFLKDKPSIAKKYDFIDTYYHIFKESSATIHGADCNDRIEFNKNDGSYLFRKSGDFGFWPLIHSNLLLGYAIKGISRFLKIEDNILPLLEKVH
jgi:Family of unknown function (DUF5677)